MHIGTPEKGNADREPERNVEPTGADEALFGLVPATPGTTGPGPDAGGNPTPEHCVSAEACRRNAGWSGTLLSTVYPWRHPPIIRENGTRDAFRHGPATAPRNGHLGADGAARSPVYVYGP